MKRLTLLMLAALFLMTSVLGCNTMRGVGKDVESGGKGIQKAVDHND
jgi:entericidin B